MWCEKCQAEVAFATSADAERLICTICGTEVGRPHAHDKSEPPAPKFAASPATKALRDPRELLARWAREDALGTSDGESLPLRTARPASASLRFDAPHPAPRPQSPIVERGTPHTHVSRSPAQASTASESALPKSVVHPPHDLKPPHYVQTTVRPAPRASNWVTVVGQVCAYFGVGGLTVGTVLALMSYFGGPASYSGTGWLIAAAGQMLLFLGVVTLVSGGMDQTTQEVARRIDTLGERLERIELAARSGPPPTSSGDSPSA